jgi:hypothetical protein
MVNPSSAVAAAEAAGFDMRLVDVSLTYTPEQRMLQHQAALDLVLEAEKAGRQLR